MTTEEITAMVGTGMSKHAQHAIPNVHAVHLVMMTGVCLMTSIKAACGGQASSE